MNTSSNILDLLHNILEYPITFLHMRPFKKYLHSEGGRGYGRRGYGRKGYPKKRKKEGLLKKRKKADRGEVFCKERTYPQAIFKR